MSEARTALGIELSAFAQKFFRKPIWEPTPAPTLASGLQHLRTVVRYVLLNPCRSGLASDPVEWEFSTHREAIGASAEAWLDTPTLRRALGCGPASFRERFHAYVSGDPTVSIAGTPLPLPAHLELLAAPWPAIRNAVLQVLHASESDLDRNSTSRRTAVHLAHRLGASHDRHLAKWLGCSSRTIRRILETAPNKAELAGIEAATLVLSSPGRFVPHPRNGSR
jgi:hypothetical protein